VSEWGGGLYGAEAAAQRYYGKPAVALDADEAAGLAGMIPNPRRINPSVDTARFARAQRRVVWLMAHAGFLNRPGLGAEPPPEPVDEDEPAPAEAPAAEPSRAPAEPPPAASAPVPAPEPSAEPSPERVAPSTPDPSPSPV